MSEPKAGPKRSLLAQNRSRDTRQSIIKAALELWSERGYGTGIEETTAEEIAARAGVAKATFYFHFARKDDILFETGWLTAQVFYDDAVKALMRGGSVDSVIDTLLVKLCRRMEKVPRLALQRMLQLQGARSGIQSGSGDDPEHFGFQRAYTVIFLQAQQSEDDLSTVSASSLGAMFSGLMMSAFWMWAYDTDVDLLALLRERSAVLLAGARHVSEDAVLGPEVESRKSRPRAG